MYRSEQPIAHRPHRRARSTRRTAVAPIAAIVVGIALLVAARTMHQAPSGRAGVASPSEQEARTERTWGDVSLVTPARWVEISRGEDHVTWGSDDRVNTVTLGSTEASVLPLPGVVKAAAAATAREFPGARSSNELATLDIRGGAPGDAAVAASFVVQLEGNGAPGADGKVFVRQVWRRDFAGGRDLVATWTSTDGRWPVDPAKHLPTPHVR